MAVSIVNVLSGIGAAVTGLAGEKVPKSGVIPGFDLAAILPALLGNKAGGSGNLIGSLTSLAAKSGLLKGSNLLEMAGSLFSVGKTTAAPKKTAVESIAGLAAAVMGNSGKGTDLVSIATMASGLAKNANDSKGLTSIASELGKTLSSANGVSFSGGATALKALDGVMGGDIKGELFKAVLKGLT
jgi:hypothetical protein